MDLTQHLKTGGYVGRGIFLGLTHDKKSAIQVYWIEARKMAHQCRNFLFDEKTKSIHLRCSGSLCEEKLSDLEYTAMLSKGAQHIVSNGPQTELLANHYANGDDLVSCLGLVTRTAPPIDVLSPRITGVTYIHKTSPKHQLCIITPPGGIYDQSIYTYNFKEIPAGTGYCVTTYLGNTNRPVPFTGPPQLFFICKSIYSLEDELWAYMPSHLRVGIAIKLINLTTGMTSVSWRSRVCCEHE